MSYAENTITPVSTKPNFIHDDNFILLKKYQQKVYDATEVSPTIRKLVNALITEENLDVIINKLIDSLT